MALRRLLLAPLAGLLAAAALAAPAAAVPVGDPFELPGFRLAGLSATFAAGEGRYLLGTGTLGRGGFGGVVVSTLAAEGAPDARPVGGSPAGVPEGFDLAADDARSRYLLAAFLVPPGGIDPGLRFEVRALDGTAVASPVVLDRAGRNPAVAFNPRRDEYLVVFTVGDAVVAQRVDADGALAGPRLRVSDRAGIGVGRPDVAYRPALDDYLVVWSSATAVLAQRLTAAGRQAGPDDLELSRGVGAPEHGAPSLAATPRRPEALVCWVAGTRVQVRELRGRGPRLAATRTVSAASSPAAGPTAVAYSPAAVEYLVLWSRPGGGDPPASAVLGQHLTPDGVEIGPDDFAVSLPLVPTGLRTPLDQFGPVLAASTDRPGYLAAWGTSIDPTRDSPRLLARRLAPAP